MLILFLTLTVLSFLALGVGFGWTLATAGRTRRSTGPEVGAEIFADALAEDTGQVEIGLAEHTAAGFKGKAVKVERGAEISFGEIKALVRTREWRPVAPFLLAIGGMFGLLLFGSLALLVGLENKLVGAVLVAVVVYAAVRTVDAFVRAR